MTKKYIYGILSIILVAFLSISVYASTYTGADVEDLDKTTPTEGASPPSEINDSIREIKAVLLNQWAIAHATSAYVLNSTDSALTCNGTFTVTLPAVADVSSSTVTKLYAVFNVGTGTITLDGNGSETIDGATTKTLLTQYSGLLIYGNGSAWYTAIPDADTLDAKDSSDFIWNTTTARQGFINSTGFVNATTLQGGVVNSTGGTVFANTISEQGPGQGVTVDGVKLKDGGIVGIVRDAARDLAVTNTTHLVVNTTASELILQDSTGLSYRATSVAENIDLTGSGAGGLDTGSAAGSTNYYAWVIYNGTSVDGLLSTSKTSPTMPTGYTYKALVGSIWNSASSGVNAADVYDSNAPLHTRVLKLGTWDMDASVWIAVAHGLTSEQIVRSVSIVIRSDDGAFIYGFPSAHPSASTAEYWDAQGASVLIYRSTDGLFDSTSFDSISDGNRGWISIEYKE